MGQPRLVCPSPAPQPALTQTLPSACKSGISGSLSALAKVNINSHWMIQLLLNINQEFRKPNPSENQIYPIVSSGPKPNPNSNPIQVKVYPISGSWGVHFAEFRTSVSRSPFPDICHSQLAIPEHCRRRWGQL